MKKNGRYDVSDLAEAQFEPGSNEQVLRNRLGIKSSIAEEKKQEYFAAVQAGLDKNYAPMERLFTEIIERSLASA